MPVRCEFIRLGGTIALERGAGLRGPQRPEDHHTPVADAIEPLSQISYDLNERFGTDFSEEDRVDTNFKFYKRATDDQAFARFFLDWLFDLV